MPWMCFTQGAFISLTGAVPLQKFLHPTLNPTTGTFAAADLKVRHHNIRLNMRVKF